MTTANTVFEIQTTLNKEIEAADKVASRAAKVSVAQKACTRCAGKGFAQFHGPARAESACFLCGGKGTIAATRDGKADQKEAVQAAERGRYLALEAALMKALAALVALPVPESLREAGTRRNAIETATRQLASVRTSLAR